MKNARRNVSKVILCIWLSIVLYGIGAKASILPPDPTNAALLYYQAFLLCPEPDEATFWLLEAVTKGADPNESLRKYLNRPFSRAAIELAQSATQIPLCDWGPLCPGGYGHNAIRLSVQRLCTLMQGYARNLAAEGHLRSALDNCIGIQRLAVHIGDETFFMFSTSRVINGRALTCIRHILGSMTPDADTLTWLNGQLLPSDLSPSRLVETLKSNCELHLQYMRDHPEAYPGWWREYPEVLKNENARRKILESASKFYDEQLESARKILERNLPYADKRMELRKLITNIQYENDSNNYSIILGDCVPYIEACYSLMVRDMANFNVLKVALEIYLIRAKTGYMPESLPKNQLKDPYTERDFEYRVTDQGFALRYHDIDLQSGGNRWLEFKVRR